MAPSRDVDGVEDATHHNGKFYSVTNVGVVHAWRRRRRIHHQWGGDLTIINKILATLPQMFDEMTARWVEPDVEEMAGVGVLVGARR
uniref:Uncharacterized protein n=1 Tax=Leersia perrieri TaxID=77586 RepID=A0A0D9W268_9ORYZ